MTHASVAKCPEILTGMFKFRFGSDDPNGQKLVDNLIGLACCWATEEPTKFSEMYVRKCSKDQFAIGFKYCLDGHDYRGSQKAFLERMKDRLYRQFGTDFAGWDLGNPTFVIVVPK